MMQNPRDYINPEVAEEACSRMRHMSLKDSEEYVRSLYLEMTAADFTRVWTGTAKCSLQRPENLRVSGAAIDRVTYEIWYPTIDMHDMPHFKLDWPEQMNLVMVPRYIVESSDAAQYLTPSRFFQFKKVSSPVDTGMLLKTMASGSVVACMMSPDPYDTTQDVIYLWYDNILPNTMFGIIAHHPTNFLLRLYQAIDHELGFYQEFRHFVSLTALTSTRERLDPNALPDDLWKERLRPSFWQGTLESKDFSVPVEWMGGKEEWMCIELPCELTELEMDELEYIKIMQIPQGMKRMSLRVAPHDQLVNAVVRESTIVNARWFILNLDPRARGVKLLKNKIANNFVAYIALEECQTQIERIMIVTYNRRWKKFIGMVPNHHADLAPCRPKIITGLENMWQGTFELLWNVDGQAKLCMQFVLNQDLVHTRPLLTLLEGCPRVFRAFLISREFMQDNLKSHALKNSQKFYFGTRENQDRVAHLRKLMKEFVIIAIFRRNNILEVLLFEQKSGDGIFIGTLPRDSNKYATLLTITTNKSPKTICPEELVKINSSPLHAPNFNIESSKESFHRTFLKALDGKEASESRYVHLVKTYLCR
ncbi:uncharacterized protein LOC106651764 [Trichogramma pretiosum]|uniref:uncharacterized protein LOC106651764 n=1 Tax=Trichogramma pretiosum TaxID=7493 RepID=UPI0006C9C6BE|nr:uncharacterized protein LOC106651764 [Trichogramma pretiosum]